MAQVVLEDLLEDLNVYIQVTVDFEDDTTPYKLCLPSESWVTERELGTLIKGLQKAKRILKTRHIKEGD